MTTVQKHMRMARDILSVAPTDTVYAAIEKMTEHGVGALLVLRDAQVVGVISERDYMRKVILQDRASKTTSVAEIMSSKVISVGPEMSVPECLALMTDKRIRHLPILQNGELLGMVSMGDLVRATIAEQKFVIDELHYYIRS